jgi:hypothetical protein
MKRSSPLKFNPNAVRELSSLSLHSPEQHCDSSPSSARRGLSRRSGKAKEVKDEKQWYLLSFEEVQAIFAEKRMNESSAAKKARKLAAFGSSSKSRIEPSSVEAKGTSDAQTTADIATDIRRKRLKAADLKRSIELVNEKIRSAQIIAEQQRQEMQLVLSTAVECDKEEQNLRMKTIEYVAASHKIVGELARKVRTDGTVKTTGKRSFSS